MTHKHWGTHLTVDFSGCNLEKITNIDNIKSFSKELVFLLNSKPYGDPNIFNNGSGNNLGYTLFQATEHYKSTIVAHFCEETCEMYLDIIGNAIIVPDAIINLVERYFQPSNYMTNFTIRDANPIPKGWLGEYTRE